MWQTFIYQPLYNALIWLVNVLPGAHFGLAIIALTVIIRLVLFPLSRKTIKNQIAQSKLQPYVQMIKQKVTDNTEQAKQIMELYKLNKSNPFAGCLVLIVQLPILFALYRVFTVGVHATADLLYPSITIPADFSTIFFGIDLAQASIIMAILAGAAQFAQLSLMPMMRKQKSQKVVVSDAMSDQEKMQAKATNMMQNSMRFILPVMIIFFAWKLPAAVALYWMTSTLFVVFQEIAVRLSHADAEVVLPESIKHGNGSDTKQG